MPVSDVHSNERRGEIVSLADGTEKFLSSKEGISYILPPLPSWSPGKPQGPSLLAQFMPSIWLDRMSKV